MEFYKLKFYSVKLLYIMGTKFRGLMMIDMFVDCWICGRKIILNIIKVNKYFIGILNNVDCYTHQIHEIICPNDFTVYSISMMTT